MCRLSKNIAKRKPKKKKGQEGGKSLGKFKSFLRFDALHEMGMSVMAPLVCNALVVLAVVLGLLGSAGVEGSVSYDSRAITINGKRRILISGSIHYPRSTPEVRTSCFPLFSPVILK